jgi:hypothetical protein
MEVGTTSIKFADQYSVIKGMMATMQEAIDTLTAKRERPDMSRAQRRAVQSQINRINLKLTSVRVRLSTLQKDAEKLGVKFDGL